MPEGEHNDVAANIRLDRSDLRTTYTLICAARGLFRIVAAMMAPCSVKARKEVRGETISVSTHLFVQSLGGDAVERCKIRIQPNALTVNVTLCPNTAGLAFEAKAVVVAPGLTVCEVAPASVPFGPAVYASV